MNFIINTASAYAFMNITNGNVVKRPANRTQDGSILSQYGLNNSSEDPEAMTLVIDGKTYNFGGWVTEKSQVLAPPPIIRYSRSKRIIVTATNSGDEVIEQWATYGYELNIMGILVDMDDHVYPSSQIQQLSQIFETNKIATVDSKILNNLNISDIYIHKMDIEGVDGYLDTFRYSMEAKAVKPLTFSLKN